VKYKTLTTTMFQTLKTLAEHGGEVECRMGGYWTYPNAPTNDRGSPVWYASTNTIRALTTRGLLELRAVQPRTFPTRGTVTAAGHAASGGDK
jgi:hypothetical protein